MTISAQTWHHSQTSLIHQTLPLRAIIGQTQTLHYPLAPRKPLTRWEIAPSCAFTGQILLQSQRGLALSRGAWTGLKWRVFVSHGSVTHRLQKKTRNTGFLFRQCDSAETGRCISTLSVSAASRHNLPMFQMLRIKSSEHWTVLTWCHLITCICPHPVPG